MGDLAEKRIRSEGRDIDDYMSGVAAGYVDGWNDALERIANVAAASEGRPELWALAAAIRAMKKDADG